jgi:drug/metabolite transporter (DMT)-like permease
MGEIAALVTAFCWTLSSIFFSKAGQGIGAINMNRLRLIIAAVFLMVTHLFLHGSLLPVNAGGERWFWLGISGIVGLVLGDAFLFQAYIYIGARISTLIMAIVPVISAFLAWIFLGETLTAIEIGGITLAVSGVMLVVMERPNGSESHANRRQYVIGLLCAFGGAAGQAGGLILAKKGLAGDFPSISAVVIRMVVAVVVMWLVTLFMGQTRSTVKISISQPKALQVLAYGSIVGPFIGVWLSQVAIQKTAVGLASTLMALTPIMLLPFVKWVFKEEVSFRAVAGTCLAIAGVAVIFLAPATG